HHLGGLLVQAAPHVLEHADRRDGVEAGLGDVPVVHPPDLRELLQALLADLLIPPRALLFRQRHADRLHPTGGALAHPPAPTPPQPQPTSSMRSPSESRSLSKTRRYLFSCARSSGSFAVVPVGHTLLSQPSGVPDSSAG